MLNMILDSGRRGVFALLGLVMLNACSQEAPAPESAPAAAPQAASAPAESPPASAGAQMTLDPGWREVREGVDGYPAGPMLEIALRRTHGDRLEMFRWRSEFISMLSAHPGPLVEREWESVFGIPENTGAGTWTGMTLWENQQRWHDMANTMFPTQITANWLETIHMTLVFVKPMDGAFDLRTLAQSGENVLELGILVFPDGEGGEAQTGQAAAEAYLDAVEGEGATAWRFDIYPNPMGFDGPYTAAYAQNGMPDAQGEAWRVYMVSYDTLQARTDRHDEAAVSQAFAAMQAAAIQPRSDIQVMIRSTSKVCCQAEGVCSVDPDICNVSILGMGDSWAGNCSQCPRPCQTGNGMCSNLSPGLCTEVGGTVVEECPVPEAAE